MKRTKNIFLLFLLIGLIFPVFFIMAEIGIFSKPPKVELLNKVTDPDAPTLRVVADFDFEPYTFYDRNGEISGLDVELINEIANQLGMKSQITFTDWQNCKKLLQNKEADLILGLEIFSHMNGVLKTVPTSKDTLAIFGKTKIHNIAELKDKKVGLMVNSVITRIFDLNCEFVDFYTNTAILEAVDKGIVDFGICHNSVGMKIIEKSTMDLVSSVSLMNSYPAIGVRDDLPALRDAINEIIIKMSSDGIISDLDEKWIENFTKSIRDVFHKESYFFIIYFISFFGVAFLFIIILINMHHREEKLKKTIEHEKSLKKQNDILSSIAGVYNTMHIINLSKNTVKEISTTDSVSKYVNHVQDAISQMRAVMINTVEKEDVDAVLEFTDLTTVAKRLKDKKLIIAEFRGIDIGWFCAQFIPISYQNDEVEEVIFTTQIIDEMKKENERLQKLSSYDELTKLQNRRSYEEKIKILEKKNATNLTIAVFDINELKATNDNINHLAGDELIMGAAACLESVFHEIGNVYRVGGDEFTLIVEQDFPELQKYIDDLKEKISEWKGKLVQSLHISAGYACSSEIEDFTCENLKALINMAEKKMYADKAEYYKRTGRERRR